MPASNRPGGFNPQPTTPSVSIIVPVLNESLNIAGSIERIIRDFPGCELIVVDGGSSDNTVELASRYAKVVTSEPGRALQMNTGAVAASSEVLWFIHADVEVDACALHQIREALENEEVVGGGLSLRFDKRSFGLLYLSRSSNLRAKYLHWIFGDQSLFVRRSVFEAIGQFPDLPIFEDMELSRRLHRSGKLVLVRATSRASARRFVAHGTWSMIVLMQHLKVLYFLGVDPEIIRDKYLAGPDSLRPRLTKRSSSLVCGQVRWPLKRASLSSLGNDIVRPIFRHLRKERP